VKLLNARFSLVASRFHPRCATTESALISRRHFCICIHR